MSGTGNIRIRMGFAFEIHEALDRLYTRYRATRDHRPTSELISSYLERSTPGEGSQSSSGPGSMAAGGF